MPTWRPRNRASASSSRALKGFPLTTPSPLSGRSSPAITISSVDFPDPDGPISPIASPGATLRSISLRIWTRAAPVPSDRLTLEMEMVSGCKLDEARSANDEDSVRLSMPRSYGISFAAVERPARMIVHMLVLALIGGGLWMAKPAFAEAGKPIKMVVLGDSLSAGLGLSTSAAFPARLQKTLGDKGIKVDMLNAGGRGHPSAAGRD